VDDTGEGRSKGLRMPTGPLRWDEVDAEELDRIALAIVRNAMPQNGENSNTASRMAAEAAALQKDQQDLLGLGRIDTQSCCLVQRPLPRRLF